MSITKKLRAILEPRPAWEMDSITPLLDAAYHEAEREIAHNFGGKVVPHETMEEVAAKILDRVVDEPASHYIEEDYVIHPYWGNHMEADVYLEGEVFGAAMAAFECHNEDIRHSPEEVRMVFLRIRGNRLAIRGHASLDWANSEWRKPAG